jgi:hypothetical protein
MPAKVRLRHWLKGKIRDDDHEKNVEGCRRDREAWRGF